MRLVAALLMAAALQPAPALSCPTPPGRLGGMLPCVRLKAVELAAADRSESSIAHEAVGACDGPLEALESRAEAATGRDRDTTNSLRLALLDRMLSEAEDAVRERRAGK